ncbi:MAG: hypothetical protein IKL37_02690 [Alphaproteobacteria bacterium]|nr:hypothetical protein [Alphaproteobacteria bacterium]MBR6685154.1 hypothetical protein [Alphaproteobacteria bacterium]
MTKYVLRPEPILSHTHLTEALQWIGYKKYPDTFVTTDDYYESDYFIHNPLYEWISELASNEESVTKKWFNSLKTTLHYNYDKYGHETDIETATHKLFTVISDNKIKLYGIQFNSKNRDKLEYIQIPSENLKYSDFDWENAILHTNNTKYIELIVLTEDLFSTYPVNQELSSLVTYGANNYFLDDTNNKEIKLYNRGRKPKLSPEQIISIGVHATKYLQNTPNTSKTSLIYECISYSKKVFDKNIPVSTMKDYLKTINIDEK